MNPHKADMLAAVITEFDLHTLAYVGQDEEMEPKLMERLAGRKVEPPGENPADVIFLDEYGENPVGAIQACEERVANGGFLMGSKFNHQNVDIMRAVANCYNLMFVQTGPGGVWAVRK